MAAALKAGIAYFAIVFAAGFILGTIRILVVAPRLGETGAVLIELPIILLVSWLACGLLLERFSVSETQRPRVAMGGLAFALLMIAELCLSVFAFGRPVAEFLAAYRSSSGMIGLAGQLAFAAFPLMHMSRPRV